MSYSGSFVGDFHGVKEVEYSDHYLKGLKKYHSIEHHVRLVESRILHDPEYVEHHHELINSGRYKGYLHARVTKNIRIMYKIVNGVLTFSDLIAHHEMD